MAVKFENIDRRIDKINKVLAEYGISSLEEARIRAKKIKNELSLRNN